MNIVLSELATREHKRYYGVLCPLTGDRLVVRLSWAGDSMELALEGTGYYRLYPSEAEHEPDAPRVANLPLGYTTVAAFVAAWVYAIPDQRADMIKLTQHGRSARTFRRSGKWAPRPCDDRPRFVRSTEGDDGYRRVYAKDLARALKGTRKAVRIGSATFRPAMLTELCKLHGPVLEIKPGDDERLYVRSADHKTRCTIKHGAGEAWAGRNGWEALIAL